MFKKAERKRAKLRLGIAGLSGTGKTWSALEIATGMGGKIALIDTEAGRGEIYGDDFEFDCLRLDAPFSPMRYVEAINNAERSGYNILIIDSLSHAWVGDGGVLSIVEKAGGQFQNGWKAATPQHNALIEAIITAKLHIIFTMRSKSEYVVEVNEKGKHAPRKIGLAPVQRDGLEYECTVYMDMNHDHIAHVTKDNTQLYNQQYIKPTREIGIKLIEWLNSGKDVEAEYKTQFEIDLVSLAAANNLLELEILYKEFYLKYKHDENFKSQILWIKDQRKSELTPEKEISA